MIARRAVLASSVALAASAGAQEWRTLDASRQLRDAGPMSVRISYGAGKMDLAPAANGVLYRMNLRYDSEIADPISRWDDAGRTLTLGVRTARTRVSGDRKGGSMHAELSSQVPMDLELELGAVQGDLQLGGLRISDLSLKGGAADLTLRFDVPNPVRLGEMSLDIGAADVKLRRAGNAGAERIRVNVGVGSLDLDLGGEGTRDVEVSANVAMGQFTLRVPPDMGIYIDATRFLADVDRQGLEKRADGWYSANFDSAKRKVRVRLRAVLGSFTLRKDAR